eukprot:scaffold3079_cov187-Ochromonas_danica.AAC.11
MDQLPCHSLGEAIIQVLIENVKEHSLINIDLNCVIKDGWNYSNPNERYMKAIVNLLVKHTGSLQELHLKLLQGMDLIISTLLENEVHLKVLDVWSSVHPVSMNNWLISYLSNAGNLLETVQIRRFENGFLMTDDTSECFWITVAESCPCLKSLSVPLGGPCSMERLLVIFERCPSLQNVFIENTLKTDAKKKQVTILVKGTEWVQCLSYVLSRRQYQQLVDLQFFDNVYYPMEDLKSILKSCCIRVTTRAVESCFIALLKDLPHLDYLVIQAGMTPDSMYYLTDTTLIAIMKYAKSLTSLSIMRQSDFSDEVMSTMIKICCLLRSLTIRYCGLKSLEYVSRHPNLRSIDLFITKSFSKDLLEKVFREKRITWPRTLEKGRIHSDYTIDWGHHYEFNPTSRCWNVEPTGTPTMSFEEISAIMTKVFTEAGYF